MASDISLSTGSGKNTISGQIKWSGLSSGVNFSSVVSQLVAIENRTITRQETWRKNWSDKITAINGLDQRLVALKLNAQEMNERSNFLARKSASSNTGVATVVNTNSAEPGSHKITVGHDIEGRVISRSFKKTDAVGGAGGQLIINLGGDSLILAEGADFNAADTLEALAGKIQNIADAASFKIKAEVKANTARDGEDYQQLIITGLEGGSAKALTVVDPTGLELDGAGFGEAAYTSWKGSEARVNVSGHYTGGVNKSFTFMTDTTGVLGVNDITIKWADDRNNSGSFVIKASEWLADPAMTFEVFQGLEVSFDGSGGGRIQKNESFTVDAHHWQLQRAQDEGLATSERVVHQGFSDLMSPITVGRSAKFIYSYKGLERTVTVREEASLQMLVEAINSDPGNPGVKASVVNDGLGTSTSYKLVLEGKGTGADNVIRIIEPPAGEETTEMPLGAGSFAWAQRASDSLVKVDGFPSGEGEWLHRPGNTLGDVLDGLVINLQGVGSTTITVQNDVTSMAEKITQLVQSINFVLTYIDEQTKYGGGKITYDFTDSGDIIRDEEKPSGIMIGNYAFQIAKSELNKWVTSAVAGLTSDNAAYKSLSQIGITISKESGGLFVVENNTLREALNANPEDVARLFIADSTTLTGVTTVGVAAKLAEITAKLTDDESGITKTLVRNYNGIIADIDDKIDRETRRIETVRNRLEQQFTRLEVALSQLNSQASRIESAISSLPSHNS